MFGIGGQGGQANYAIANTFLDAFVEYRNSLGLLASVLDIGAMEDMGHLCQHSSILEAVRATSFPYAARARSARFTSVHDRTLKPTATLICCFLLSCCPLHQPEPSRHRCPLDPRTLGLKITAQSGRKPPVWPCTATSSRKVTPPVHPPAMKASSNSCVPRARTLPSWIHRLLGQGDGR